MNQAIFMGRLVTDPEERYTQSGTLVVTFRFAVQRSFKVNGEAETDFFNCVVFGKLAESFSKCKVTKGKKLLISAEVRNDNYTDKDGNKRVGTNIVVNAFEFCESKSAEAGTRQDPETAQPASQPQQPGKPVFVPVPDNVDDGYLPFN